MRRFNVWAFCALLCFSALSAEGQVVISQLYGGGGNSGATLKNDFIELFNAGSTAVDLSTWSVQYASSGGNTWTNKTDLSGSIQPGGYYLVKQAAGTGGTADLPAAQATGNIAMSATAGKVALVASQSFLSCGVACASAPDVRDFVGYGGANNAEGSPTGGLSNTTAALRKNNGCTDTNNNSSDFVIGAPSPRNSSSASHSCGVVVNNPPAIQTPPATTVTRDAAPFSVTITGSDDGGIYNWSATAGSGIAAVALTAGQGTSSATFQVTLQSGFTGAASFTATLSDNVNQAVSRAVPIQVDAPVPANTPPAINAPANPITIVAQDAAPFTVGLSGTDDNSIFQWSALSGTGVSSVVVSSGQGTAGPLFTVTLQAGYSGTATFTAQLSDGVNAPASRTVNITVTPAPPPPLDHMVISQIYGGGGNSGATYRHDYVELYNASSSPFDLGGWTVQYASSTGSSWQITPLGGVVQPGQHYLVALASGGMVGALLPVANASGDMNLSASSGKVALVRGGDPLSGECPTLDPLMVDFVGYGSANCREGSSTAPSASNTTALFRKNGGFADTNINGADFVTGAPNPRTTTPIQEIGPYVLSVDPRNNSSTAPRDLSLTITFTENVEVSGAWFNIQCASTGAHNSATVAGSGRFWIVTPNATFQPAERCTATLYRSAIRDADLDDSSPNTDNLNADYSWSFTVATGAAPAYAPEVHTLMGNPSGARADLSTPNNYLMVKPEYTLSYNRDRGTPNWVSWHLDSAWVGTLSRVDTFRPDPAVPADWYRVTQNDYFASGFDRGHMVPSADRDPETSIPINQATFLMTNMIPQAPDNNQGPWANLENYLRTLLPANELYLVAGGAGANGTIANGKVTVPAQTWKVALVIPRADGDDLSRVTAASRTIAVIMPNTQGIRTNNPNDWQNYLVSVDQVEALTGYDFFAEVSDAVENAIEAGVNGVNPPGVSNQSFSTREDAAATFTIQAANPTNNTLSYTIVQAPARGTLSGEGATQTYTPSADFNGTDSFTFRAADGPRQSNLATMTITVLEVNDPPAAADDTRSTNEDVPLTFAAAELTANDSRGPANENGQTLTLRSVTGTAATRGTVALSNGHITYVPEPNFHGSASFQYEVCDNGFTAGLADARCASGTVAVTVLAVNDAPVLEAIAPRSIEVGGTLSFTAAASDVDLPAQPLSYSLAGNVPAGAAIQATTGAFSWTPSAMQAGLTHSFQVVVSDGAASTSTNVTVVVTDTVAPQLSALRLSRTEIWPPNHKMVDVRVDYTATDLGDPAPSCTLSVTSNEPVDGTGDGDTAPDWEIVDANNVKVRAERAGSGNGRIYTITAACRDRFANLARASATVTVPKSQGKGKN